MKEGVGDEDIPAELTRSVIISKQQPVYHQGILSLRGDWHTIMKNGMKLRN